MDPETAPIIVIDQRIKWMAIVATILFIGACPHMKWERYVCGLTCYGGENNLLLRLLMCPPLLYLIGFLSFLLVNSVTVLVAICFRRVRRTVGLCLLLTWGAWLAVEWGTQPLSFLDGFRTYVGNRVSLDDLRQVRKAIIATRENNQDVNYFRVQRRADTALGTTDFEGRWNIDFAKGHTFHKTWQQICQQTKLEKLIGKHAVGISSDGGTVTLRWGGGFEEWGITIGENKIEREDPNHIWVHLADDILLFDGG